MKISEQVKKLESDREKLLALASHIVATLQVNVNRNTLRVFNPEDVEDKEVFLNMIENWQKQLLSLSPNRKV